MLCCIEHCITLAQVAAYRVDTVPRGLPWGARWLTDLIAVLRQLIDLCGVIFELIAPAAWLAPIAAKLAASASMAHAWSI